MVNAACVEKIFAGKDSNILLLLITARVSMEENLHAIVNQKLLIVINDVPAIKLLIAVIVLK